MSLVSPALTHQLVHMYKSFPGGALGLLVGWRGGSPSVHVCVWVLYLPCMHAFATTVPKLNPNLFSHWLDY